MNKSTAPDLTSLQWFAMLRDDKLLRNVSNTLIFLHFIFLYKPPCSAGYLGQAVEQSKLAKGKDGKIFFLYSFNKCVKTVFLPYEKLG